VDQIDALACPASSIHYQWYPAQATTTRLLGAINMLGLAKRLPWNDSGVLGRQEVISARRGQLADRKVLWRGFGRGNLAGSVQRQEGGKFGHAIGAPPALAGTEAVSSTG
jgi:hypothetical protein